MTWTTWSSVGTSSSWLKSRMRSMVAAVLCLSWSMLSGIEPGLDAG